MKFKKEKAKTLSMPTKIDKVALELKKKYSITIKANARQYVSRQVDLAVQKKVIQSDEMKNAVAALYAAGVKGAARYGKRQVHTRDIQKVWQDVRVGPGNCPPNECIFRTVISRKEEFGNDFPLFIKLTNE